jgi:AAA domain
MAVLGGLPTFRKAADFAGTVGMDAVIFGPPGIGKTSFLATAQDSELGKDLLWFDIDSSVVTLEDRTDIAMWPDRQADPDVTWQKFRKVVDQLIAAASSDPDFKYKTWGFDSITSIYTNLILPKVTGSKEAQPHQGQWGEANRILIKFMTDVMTMNARGIHTIFLGHVTEEREILDPDKPDNYIIHLRLAGTPKGRDEILRTVGTVGYYDWDRRFQNRELRFRPDRKVDAPKFRRPQTGPQVPDKLLNPTMGDLFKYARRGK